MGQITNWQDQRIARVNPGMVLPDLPITILQRPEGTGSRYVFTKFLAKTSPQFSKWIKGVNHESPREVTMTRSKGVADKLAATPGAIGFVEYNVAVQFELQYGLVQNSSGKYVTPFRQSVDAASAAMSAAATEQAAASEEINGNVARISGSTQESSAASGETATACMDLSRLAFELHDLVNRFQLEAKPESVQPLPRSGPGSQKALSGKLSAKAVGRK